MTLLPHTGEFWLSVLAGLSPVAGCVACGNGDEEHGRGEHEDPRASRPAPIQDSEGTEAATLMRTATGREPSAFIATTVQLPLRSGQVRVRVPGPATWAAQMRPAGHGRGSAAAVRGVGGVVVGDAADGV